MTRMTKWRLRCFKNSWRTELPVCFLSILMYFIWPNLTASKASHNRNCAAVMCLCQPFLPTVFPTAFLVLKNILKCTEMLFDYQ